MSKKLFTIGHSIHSLEEFLELLQIYEISHLVDVRTIPRSRRVPWFNKEELPSQLKKNRIAYTHLKELGGLRKPSKESINMAWRNSGFRGFADYMQTSEFYEALKKLNELVKQEHNVAIMCAESLPWRCHRSLISDAEIVRGYSVRHIMSKTSAKEHKLTGFAQIDRSTRPIRIYYPDLLNFED